MQNTADSKPVPILYDTYLAFVRNAVGSKMFRNFYAYVDGEKKDLVNDGELACGFFVSTVLHSLKLTKEPHLTVNGTEKDLQQSGWQEVDIKNLRPGCVLIWSEQRFDSEKAHKHIGVFTGNERAVSTDSKQGFVTEHHFTFEGGREIEKAYWHTKLQNGSN